jgi:MFS family permease
MSQVNAVWQLYLFYGVLVGIGMSATFIPQLSLVARWFIKRRAMATGLVMAGDGVGIMIAPPLATWLISVYGWRTSYVVVGIIAAALVILAAQFLKREPSEMGLLPYGANKLKEENSHSEAVGFSLQQAIHTRQFWLVCALSFFLTFNIAPITVHIVIHAIGLGVSAVAAAGILSILGGLTLAGRLIWGALADRIGNELVLILGFVLISCALFWLLAANDLWMFCLFAAIFGFGVGCWVAIIPLMGKIFGLRSHGALLGCAYSGSMAGGAIGAPLAGHIFDIAHSYQLAWTVCAGASIIAIILTLLLKQASRGSQKIC